MKSDTMFNFGIKGKLLTLIGGMLLVFLLATIFAVVKMGELKGQIDFLGLERIPLAEKLAEMETSTHANLRYTWLSMGLPDGSEMQKAALEKLETYGNSLVSSSENYATFNLSPEGRNLIEQAIPLTKQIRSLTLEAKKLILLHTPVGEAAVKKLMTNDVPPIANKLTDIMNALDKKQAAHNTEAVIAAQDKARNGQTALIIICALTSLIVSTIGFLFASKLSNQLLSITEQVGDASSQVSAASGQLSASAEELSNSAQGQASAVEEASASLTEISGMIEANVKTSEDSNQLAAEVYSYTEETLSLMHELSEAMSKILESNVKIEQLVKVIEEIGAKTEVIDDIVFKTQLLSFNASVEAERAGEHGRGFAVVAQEVGNLAQMSGKAANEISSIVKVSIKDAETIAHENKTRVETGGNLTASANKKMAEMMGKISLIQSSTSNVVNASKEQSYGINQITTSVDSINQTTQETASTAEESASASEELSGQSAALLSLVNNLRIIISGESHYKIADIRSTHTKTKEHRKIHTSSKPNNVITFNKNTKPKKNFERPKNSSAKTSFEKNLNSADSAESAESSWEKI